MKDNKIQQNKYKKTLIVFVLLLTVILLILLINKNKQNSIQKIALGENALEVGGETLDISKVISADANSPTVGAGMIPIKWNDNAKMWEITTKDDWYDYANGKWANVMLSDGYYKSEIQAGINWDRVAEKNVGKQVQENELGTIFTWIPRLAYLEDRVEFLKGTNVLDYMWKTESCFNLEKYGVIDLGFEGIWIGQTEFANETEIASKNTEMQQEENKEGLIANEQVTTLTESEKTVVKKLQEKYSVGQNETMLKNTDTMNLRQVIKIVNAKKKLPIIGEHVATDEGIIVKCKYCENGIKYVVDTNGNKLENNTSPISDEETQYTFYIIDNLGNIRKYKMNYGAGKPYLKGFNKSTTFYVTYNENGEEDSSKPIGEKAPANWYNYESQQWANIVCRDNGNEIYYTWIPRYMYKINDDGSETVDAKIVDLDNVYTDPKTEKQYNLNETDYKLPEAFTWEDPEDENSVIQLPGFWATKYQLRYESTYHPNIYGGDGTINVNGVVAQFGTSYTYEMYLIKDGKRLVYNEGLGEYIEGTEPIKLTGDYKFTNVPYGNYAVNVIVKDSSGKHVRAVSNQVMVSKLEMDAPEVTGFRVDTTYIVTYDENGNENHTQTLQSVLKEGAIIKADNTLEKGEIDVSKINGVWYDYADSKWANIVTINNGKTIYYTWIPRYEYKLNTADQKTNVVIIPKTQTTPDAGYQIPEAFTWEDPNDSTKVIQLSGFWATKYQLRY